MEQRANVYLVFTNNNRHANERQIEVVNVAHGKKCQVLTEKTHALYYFPCVSERPLASQQFSRQIFPEQNARWHCQPRHHIHDPSFCLRVCVMEIGR